MDTLLGTSEATPQTTFAEILQETEKRKNNIKLFEKAPITTKARNWAAAGMIGGGLLLTIMFAAQIITGMFALVLTASTVGGLFYGLRFLKKADPLIQQKTKNFVMKKMVEEARNNAIYQLENLVLQRESNLSMRRKARTQLVGLIQKLKGKIDPAKAGTPHHTKKVDMVNTLVKAAEQMEQQLEQAAHANAAFESQVREYKILDEATGIFEQALGLIGANESKLDEMLSLEAFDAIDTSYNTALVALDRAVEDAKVDQAAAAAAA